MAYYSQLINESMPGASQAVPAATTVPAAQYPKVYADGRAIFLVHLPSAKSVLLQGGQGLCETSVPMLRDVQGNWSVTLPPAVAGFHYYWFNVDDVIVNDPGSETFFAYNREVSGIEIPDPQLVSSDLVTAAVVPFYGPHAGAEGRLHEHQYHSRVTGKRRRCIVYTPPGYDDEGNRTSRYPVLYLLPDAGEDETAWSRQGAAHYVMDNLIKGSAVDPFAALFGLAIAKVRPMIVIMDRGDSPADKAVDPLVQLFTKELMPTIEDTYRTLADGDHRAIAGIAHGAVQAFTVARSRPHLFSHIGLFSAAAFSGSAPQGLAAWDGVAFDQTPDFKRTTRLLWLGAGTAELAYSEAMQKNVEILRAGKIRYVQFYSPGTGHEWQTWRTCLREFVPRLFQT